MKRNFFRVANIETGQGLWYDSKGCFTGLIHEQFSFCANNELQMPFDKDIVGWLSATTTKEELYQWFPVKDIIKLQEYGWFMVEYECEDYKQHQNHWVILQSTSVLVTKHIIVPKKISMYEQLLQTIKDLVGNEYLYLDSPVILADESMYAINVWAVCVSPSNTLYVQDASQEWHPVKENETLALGRIETKINQIKKRMYGKEEKAAN